MEMEDTQQEALPPKRTRNPIIWVVLHNDEQGVQVTECDTRKEAGNFIKTLPDPTKVIKLYRVSAVVTPKFTTVASF